MCGGKSTTTQATTIPPEVLARYNAVNAYAEQVAQQPFQRYGGEFVAPINEQQMMGINNINQSYNMAQPYFNQATSALNAAYGQATPLYGQSLNTMGNAVNQGQNYYNQSLATMQGGLGQAQNYYANALNQIGQGGQQAQSMYNQSLTGISNGLNQAQNMYNQSLGSMAGGMLRANNLYDLSLGNITSGVNIGSRYGTDATRFINQAGTAAQPYMTQSGNYVTAGLGAASPLMSQAQQYLQGGTQAVNAEEFGAGQVQKYMSPYMSQVIDAQTKLAEQQNAIQRSALNSQAIGAGAFGGDRAGIAQANLAGQQSLAQQATMGNLLQQGYGQALGAFQQQQGVNLAAAQANRAAQQFGQQAAAQMAQQAFGQNLAASQQMGNLGQALFGQSMSQGEALANLGQQLYAQNIGAANARAGIAQNQFGMSAQQAAMQQAAAQGMFGMQAQQAALQQQAAQGMFGISAQQAQMQQQTGQSMFNMSAQQAAMQQAAAQGMFGMQAQQAALQQQAAQGLYGMGMQYAQGLAGLGTGAQAAALQGAQAQIGAGTLQQQTQQAQDTAMYQQFLQERGYPFQVAQFLANIAMGTGSLSGSTTTTTGPNSFFSDRRLKKDIKEIGETHDGLPIYSYKYKGGDDLPRIGVMADEAREKYPDAVSRVGGVDTVDYEKIANRASEGGGVMPSRAGQGYYDGGVVSPDDLSAIIAKQREFLGPHGQGGLYGQSSQNMPGQKGVVPLANLHVSRPRSPGSVSQQPNSMRQALSQASDLNRLGETTFGDQGIFGSQGWPAKLAQKAGLIDGDKNKTPRRSASSQSNESDAKSIPAETPAQKTTELQPATGGVKPSNSPQQSVVGSVGTDAITPPDQDIFAPVALSARGGVVPRKAGGGFLREGVLPYQAENKYGPEQINEEESGEKYSLMGDEKGGGKSGSSGGIGSAIGAAASAVNAGSKLAEGASWLFKALPAIFVARGGVIPRQGFAGGSTVNSYDDIIQRYADEEGVPASIARQVAYNESRMNPIAQADTSSAGGLFGMTNGTLKALGGDPALKYDPEHNIKHGVKYIGQNYRALTSGEDDPDAAAKTYLGHFFGTGGAKGVLSDTSAPIAQTLSNYDQAVAANAKIRAPNGVPISDWTGEDALAWARAKMSGQPIDTSGEPVRRRVAGATYEDGKTYVNGKRTYEGGIEPPTDYRTGKPYEGWGDFLTSRQFIVPVLSGIGAMAASPSRYWGGAALQGLGAAAQSYAGMEKAMTEGEERRALTSQSVEAAKKIAAETAGVEQKNIQSSLSVLQNGSVIVWTQGPSGPQFMFAADYDKLKREGKAPQLLGYKPQNAKEIIQKTDPTLPPPVDSPSTGAKPGEKTQPGQEKPKQANTASGLFLPDSTLAAADRDRTISLNQGPGYNDLAAESKAWAGNVMKRAAGASEAIKNTADMAQNVSTAAQDRNWSTMGFAYGLRSEITSLANTLLRAAGQEPIAPNDSAQQVQRKLQVIEGELAAATNGFKADASLSTLLSATPDLSMDPDAASKLAADLWVARQRLIDKNNFRIAYGEKSNQFFNEAEPQFNSIYSQDRYIREQRAIQHLIRTNPEFLKDLRSGKLKSDQIDKVFSKWMNEDTPEIHRYFVQRTR